MATKKEPSIEDRLKVFKDVIKRLNVEEFKYTNNCLYAISSKKNIPILFNVDSPLMELIVKDDQLKDNLISLDPTTQTDIEIQEKLLYAEDMSSDNGWVPIIDSSFADGKITTIDPSNFKYEIPINISLIPIRFKKSETDGFSYKIFYRKNVILVIRKKFDSQLDGGNFYIGRAFVII